MHKEVLRLNQGPFPTCSVHAMALCMQLHLRNMYPEEFAPTADHIKDAILAHVGYEGTYIPDLCRLIKERMMDNPKVWFRAGDHLIRIDMAWEKLLTFDDMRAHVSPEFPVVCAVQMPGCGHAVAAFDKEHPDWVLAYNSWGDGCADVQVTQGGEVTMKSMPFIYAILLRVTISHMRRDGKDMPLPVACYVETAGKNFVVKKGPVDACAPSPPVKQRVKRPVKPWPRGKELPLSKRMARQVAKTASVKVHFDRKMALSLKRWIRIFTNWRPGQKSQEMKTVEELSTNVSLFAKVNRPSMEAQWHRMKEQLAKRTLLREEKRSRKRPSLELTQRVPLMSNDFDELPPLPENPISDTESEANSVRTLQYECEDECEDEENKEQDLSNC